MKQITPFKVKGYYGGRFLGTNFTTFHILTDTPKLITGLVIAPIIADNQQLVILSSSTKEGLYSMYEVMILTTDFEAFFPEELVAIDTEYKIIGTTNSQAYNKVKHLRKNYNLVKKRKPLEEDSSGLKDFLEDELEHKGLIEEELKRIIKKL